MGNARRAVVRLVCVLLVASTLSASVSGVVVGTDAPGNADSVAQPERSTAQPDGATRGGAQDARGPVARTAAERTGSGRATAAQANATPPTPITEAEPNDAAGGADPVSRGDSVRGIISGQDRDVFALEASAGESLTLRLDRRGGPGRFLVGVLAPGEEPRNIAFATAGGGATVDVSANRTGTWYVLVTPVDPGARGHYTLSVPDGANRTEERADPTNDTVGWEDGYWYDDPIDVDQSDGLTAAEQEAYLARAKARVEYVRRAEFDANVSVEILSRDEFVNETRAENRTGTLNSDRALRTWYNQRYESAFIVGEDTNAVEAVESGDESTVLGFYDPRNGRLVVVSDESDTPVIDNATLVHELTHALQDQRVGFERIRENVRTTDESNAALGLTEGEANYVEALYSQRCADGTWDCVSTPERERPDRSGVNRGAFAIVYQPYSDGPPLVDRIVRRGGWGAVDGAYRDPPASTEQTIDPAQYPNARPATVSFGDLPGPLDFAGGSRNGWELVTADTLGEAWIYSMFYYQGVAYDNTIVPESDYRSPDAGRFDTFDYDSEPSDGWGNDYFLPYSKGEQEGYVWVTKWDTARDAREFHGAYRQVLRGHGAERVDGRTWVIRNGSYADAFAVVRQGRSVVVVNAPTVGELGDLYPGIRVNERSADRANATSVDRVNATSVDRANLMSKPISSNEERRREPTT